MAASNGGGTATGPEDRAVGQEIEAQRKYHGLSRESVVKDAGVSLTYLRDVEAGRTSVRLSALYRICDAIGVNIRSVLDGADRRMEAGFADGVE